MGTCQCLRAALTGVRTCSGAPPTTGCLLIKCMPEGGDASAEHRVNKERDLCAYLCL